MAKSDAVIKLLEEEDKNEKDLKKSIDRFTSALVDQNEELIATFVEGTKRLIKKEAKDITPNLESLENTTRSYLEGLRQGISGVEKAVTDVKQAVKAIKEPDNSTLILETRTSKNQLKKINEKLENFILELPKEAKEAIPVRLSDGKDFYNAIESIASFPVKAGGGGGEFAYMDSSGKRGYGLTDTERKVVTSNQVLQNEILTERVTNTDGASTALSTFGATSGKYNMITMITAFNSSDTAGYVDIRNGTTGSIIFTIPLPAGGGAVCPFFVPLRQPSSGTALAYDVSGALSTVYLSFVGYKSTT